MITRSQIKPEEYHPYFERYINLNPPHAHLLDSLESGLKNSISLIDTIHKPLDFAYADGKWTIGQVIMHNIDTERVFAYRALRFMRGDTTPLEGFDQDVFNEGFKDYAFAKAYLIDQLESTRQATISLYTGLNNVQLERIGVASGKQLSVRTIPFLILGHHMHHEQILSERYL